MSSPWAFPFTLITWLKMCLSDCCFVPLWLIFCGEVLLDFVNILFYDKYQMVIFSSIIPSTVTSWHPTAMKTFSCPHLFFYLFLFVLIHGFLFNQCVLYFNLISFDAQTVPDLARGWPSMLFFVSVWHFSTSLWHFLSDTRRCPKLIMYSPCPQLGICHFSKEAWSSGWYLKIKSES